MIRLIYFGHSAFQVESAGHTLLIDPFITGNPHTKTTIETLRPDFILLTHGHADHYGDTEALAAASGATVICNYELGMYARARGVAKVHQMSIGGGFDFPFGFAKLLPAFHGSSMPDEHGMPIYLGQPAGILLQLGDLTLYHLGDTGLFGDLALIGALHPVDVAMVPVGGNFTMGPECAYKAVQLLQPKVAIPIHYNTMPEISPGAARLDAWITAVTELGVRAEVMAPDSVLTF